MSNIHKDALVAGAVENGQMGLDFFTTKVSIVGAKFTEGMQLLRGRAGVLSHLYAHCGFLGGRCGKKGIMP